MCRNLVTKKMHFSKKEKNLWSKSSKSDLIEMMKVAYKDECTIGISRGCDFLTKFLEQPEMMLLMQIATGR